MAVPNSLLVGFSLEQSGQSRSEASGFLSKKAEKALKRRLQDVRDLQDRLGDRLASLRNDLGSAKGKEARKLEKLIGKVEQRLESLEVRESRLNEKLGLTPEPVVSPAPLSPFNPESLPPQAAIPAVANAVVSPGSSVQSPPVSPPPADALLSQLNLTPPSLSGEQFQSEISAAVALGGRLFVLSSGGGSTLQVSDFTNPAAPQLIERLSYGNYISTSVAAFGNLVAVALTPNTYDTTPARGVVRFFQMAGNGQLIQLPDVDVGYLPDGMAFSADGRQLVIANEGQPDTTYAQDPFGSVGIIDIAFPNTEPTFGYTELNFAAVALPVGVRLSGPVGTTAAKDIEPEYVSILGAKAYVTLQENNAVAVVDLTSRRIEAVRALGSIDYGQQAVDLSDKDGAAGSSAFLPKLGQPFFGLRMPDGISAFEVNSRTYFITANEGDSREYGAYVDVTRNAAAPNGRLNTIEDPAPTGPNTDTAIGSRSLSIFDAKTGAMAWDSGSSLQTIAVAAGTYTDTRSDDKGMEPESVITVQLQGRTYAIAAMERGTSSTLAIFDVSDPTNGRYVSHRVIQGSVSPEGLQVIDAASSPTGRSLLLVSNEVSNTLDVLDLAVLIATPGAGSAGFFEPTMLKDLAGGPQLQLSSLLTNGEFTNGLEPGDSLYAPTGIFDGLGAYDNGDGTYTVLANSEIGATGGVPYLVNGVPLTGARIHKLIVDKDSDNYASNGFQSAVVAAGIAYDTIVDATGAVVTDAAQLNGGFNRFCSGSYEQAERFGDGRGFVDALYLTGEEADEGLLYALDTAGSTLYALPGLGRAGWETAVQVDTGSASTVGVLLLDDNTSPIYLWVGSKSTGLGASFLERNGLAASQGNVYTWVPTAGSIGTDAGTAAVPDSADLAALPLNTAASGTWTLVASGTTVAGLNEAGLRAAANALGALQLSRLEDASINPADGQQVVFATTGNSAFGGADTFGNLITLNLSAAFDADGLVADGNRTDLAVIYDGDRSFDATKISGAIDTAEERAYAAAFGTTIIRNPDNLTWSADGSIYVQEDRSVAADYFAQQEASVWKLSATATDPLTGQAEAERWLQIDRSAVPTFYGQTDPRAAGGTNPDPGNWESSGIIDVSEIYGQAAGNSFLADVQAHSITDGTIGGSGYLVQGGQLDLIQVAGSL